MNHPVYRFIVLGGWAQPLSALEPLCQVLKELGRVTALELNSSSVNIGQALDKALQSAKDYEESVVVVGWSLGGLLAIGQLSQASLLPLSPHLKGLVLIGCNPKFVGNEAWPGVSKAIFDEFTDQLVQSSEKLLQRFNRLQLLGAAEAKVLARASDSWRSKSQAWGQAQLLHSLSWLSEWDKRPQLAALDLPVLHLLGAKDALVPSAQLEEALTRDFPGQMVRMVDGMPHYPDASSCVQIAILINDFLHDE